MRGVLPTLSRLAECLLLGVCCAVTSLGVVTVGPALAAAATVVRDWESGHQPRLVATFLATVRTETARLLVPQLALVAALALVWLDVAVAGAGLPGGSFVRVVVGAGGAFAVLTFLLMFPVRAAHGGTWWSCWARSASYCRRRPWLPCAVLTVAGIAALLVAASPPTIVLVAGPLMLATGVLFSRASGRTHR